MKSLTLSYIKDQHICLIAALTFTGHVSHICDTAWIGHLHLPV